jgi:hypothetical protein
VRLLYSCWVDLSDRNEYLPYHGSGLDLQSLPAVLGIGVDRPRGHQAILQPIFDAVAREISSLILRPARASRSTPSTAARHYKQCVFDSKYLTQASSRLCTYRRPRSSGESRTIDRIGKARRNSPRVLRWRQHVAWRSRRCDSPVSRLPRPDEDKIETSHHPPPDRSANTGDLERPHKPSRASV